MTLIIYNTRFKQFRKSAAAWAAADTVLYDGEIGIEEHALPDTDKFKIGDGVTGWNSLPYAVGNFQPLDSDLTDIAALTPADDDIIQRKGGVWTKRTLAQFKTDIGLGVVPLEADVSFAGRIALTDNTPLDLCYLDLPAGLWDLSGNICFVPAGGTTSTILRVWIDSVSATQPLPPNGGAFVVISVTIPTGNGNYFPAGSRIINVPAGPDLRVYLTTRANFSGGTLHACGHLIAKRVV